jgi:hypothetical protein
MGGLIAYTTEDERKYKLRHNLRRIWKAFKQHNDPLNDLAHFDALVRSLHKYEDIRYPERIVQQGMASSVGGRRQKPQTRAPSKCPPSIWLSVMSMRW